MNAEQVSGRYAEADSLVDHVMLGVRRQIGYMLPDSLLRAYAEAALAEFSLARVTKFVPLLATRVVLARVRHLTRSWGEARLWSDHGPRAVLFVCVHNSGRSVMAEQIFNRLARERGIVAQARSAGTHPLLAVDPIVASAMAEVGIDVAGYRPRLLNAELVRDADLIFAMGCALSTASCPTSMIKSMEDWSLDDPRGKSLPEVRLIRDQVQRQVLRLIDNLAAVAPSHGLESRAYTYPD